MHTGLSLQPGHFFTLKFFAMQKAIKHFSILVLLSTLFGCVFYAIRDRFDIVSVLLLIANFIGVAILYLDQPRMRVKELYRASDAFRAASDRLENAHVVGGRPVAAGGSFDPEELLESYDNGFRDGIADLINCTYKNWDNLELAERLDGLKSIVHYANSIHHIARSGSFLIIETANSSYDVIYKSNRNESIQRTDS